MSRRGGGWGPTGLGVIFLLGTPLSPLGAEYLDPRAVLESLPPPIVEYPAADTVKVLRPPSELNPPENPPAPSPETRPVQPLKLPPRPPIAAVATATGQPDQQVIAGDSRVPEKQLPYLGRLQQIWQIPGRATASPMVAPATAVRSVSGGAAADRRLPVASSGSRIVSSGGPKKEPGPVAAKPRVASEPVSRLASATLPKPVVGTASLTVTAIRPDGTASPASKVATPPADVSATTAPMLAVATGAEIATGSEGVASIATGASGPFRDQILQGENLLVAGKFDELQQLVEDTPGLDETPEAMGWAILIGLQQQKVNYALVRGKSERLLKMPGQENNTVGHWGLAHASLYGRKPDPDKAFRSLEIVLTAKDRPAGATSLYWTMRAKRYWYVWVLVMAAVAGGIDFLRKRLARWQAARQVKVAELAALQEMRLEKPAEAATSDLPEPSAQEGGATPQTTARRGFDGILDKVRGMVETQRERIERHPFGKKLMGMFFRKSAEASSQEIPMDATTGSSTESAAESLLPKETVVEPAGETAPEIAAAPHTGFETGSEMPSETTPAPTSEPSQDSASGIEPAPEAEPAIESEPAPEAQLPLEAGHSPETEPALELETSSEAEAAAEEGYIPEEPPSRVAEDASHADLDFDDEKEFSEEETFTEDQDLEGAGISDEEEGDLDQLLSEPEPLFGTEALAKIDLDGVAAGEPLQTPLPDDPETLRDDTDAALDPSSEESRSEDR